MLLTLAKRSIIPSSPLSPTHNISTSPHLSAPTFLFCLIHLSFHPHSMEFVLYVIFFFFFCFMKSQQRGEGLSLFMITTEFKTDLGLYLRNKYVFIGHIFFLHVVISHAASCAK